MPFKRGPVGVFNDDMLVETVAVRGDGHVTITGIVERFLPRMNGLMTPFSDVERYADGEPILYAEICDKRVEGGRELLERVEVL